MIRTHQCITLACDECESDFHDDDYVAHFRNLEDAQKTAEEYGWLVTNVRILCSGCTAKEACALTEHVWGEPIEIETEHYSGTVRRCNACETGDYNPPLIRITSEDGR